MSKLKRWINVGANLAEDLGYISNEFIHTGTTIEDCRLMGKCRRYNGTSNYSTFKNSSITNFSTDNFTILCKFNTSDVNTLAVIGGSKDAAISSSQKGYSLYIRSGKLELSVCDATNEKIFVSNTTLVPNTWYTVSITFTYPSTIRLYINCQLDSASAQGSNLSGSYLTSSSSFNIGTDNGNRRYFNGLLKDFILFNSILSDSDLLKYCSGELFDYVKYLYTNYNTNFAPLEYITPEIAVNISNNYMSDGATSLGLTAIQIKDFNKQYLNLIQQYGYDTVPVKLFEVQELSGGVKVGTDSSVNDNLTTYTNPTYVGNNCLTFSGAQYVRATGYVPSIGSSDIYARVRISFDAYPTAPELAFIMSQYATADNKRAFGFGINSGGYLAVFTSSNGTAANVQTATTNRFDLDTEYNVTIEKSGTVVNVTINDSSFTMPGSAVAILYASDAEFLVGASWLDYGAKTTRFFTSGCIFDAEFRVGGVQQIRCPMSEGWGTVNYDTSGNGRHGTMVNFTEAVAWGTTQDILASNIKNGFNIGLVSDGVDDYINTGVKVPVSGNIKIELGGRMETPLGTEKYFFGVVKSGKRLRLGRVSSAGGDGWRWDLGGNSNQSFGISDLEYHDWSFEVNGTTKAYNLIQDGVSINSGVASDWNLVNIDYNIYMMAVNNDNVNVIYQSRALYTYFRIYTDGNLVRDFRPLVNGTFIDVVNNVIYSNNGTGSFNKLYIPSLSTNPLIDVLGEDIRYPGGYCHNGAESKIKQTDSRLLPYKFWSADGSTFDSKSYSDIVNSTDPRVKRYLNPTNAELIDKCVTYL